MKISAIQPNFANRIMFKSEEQKPQAENKPEENQGMSKNTKIAAGVVTAAVALAGLGYLGYKGKLGTKIQKLLGGAEDATKNLGKNPDVTPKNSDEVKIPGGETSSPKTPEVKSEPAETVKPSANPAAAEVDETYKFLTKEEFQKMERPKAYEQIGLDIEQIEQNTASQEEAFNKINEYMLRYKDMEFDYSDKGTLDFLDKHFSKMLTDYNDIYDLPLKNKHQLLMAVLKVEKLDFNSAEKYLMEIINSDLADKTKLKAFELLHALKGQSNPEEVAAIFDKTVEKDISRFQEQQKNFNPLVKNFVDKNGDINAEEDEVLKTALGEYFDSKSYFNNIIYDSALPEYFGKDNKTIQTVQEMIKHIDEFWDSIEVITSRYNMS